MNEFRRGAVQYGPLSATDRRVDQLIQVHYAADRRHEPFQIRSDSLLHLPGRAGQPTTTPFSCGRVTYSLPFLNWYRVQLDRQLATIPCRHVSDFNCSPLAGRRIGNIAPGSQVLVYHEPGLAFGMILGVLPPEVIDPWVYRPLWILQGGNTGWLREAAHKQGLAIDKGGGIRDYSAGGALDATLYDEGLGFFTGAGLFLNPFLLQLRVSETCGLWLNYLGRATRLAGRQLEIWGSGHLLETCNDHGELAATLGQALYPWEELGMLQPGLTIDQRYSDEEVQYRKPVGARDLAAARRSSRPYCRRRDWGGYLGQGGLRTLSAPAAGGQFNDADHTPIGLFQEAIGADGSYLLHSAHSIGLVKRLLVPAPQRRKAPADPHGDGQPNAGSAYKPSGHYGSGTDHRVQAGLRGEPGQDSSAADDLIAYLTNWKAIHAFYYHFEDFALPEEREHPLGRAQDPLDYGVLEHRSSLPPPPLVALRIDHRYNSVDFYRRTAYFLLHPNGDVSLGCGSGSQLVFRDGRILVEAPGGVDFNLGGQLTVLAGGIVLRGHASVDIDSVQGDLRLASRRHTHLLGGDVLVDATEPGGSYDFHNRIGEEVQSTGIVLKSASRVVTWSDDLYLRSGVGSRQAGTITLDAGRREENLVIHAQQIVGYTRRGLTVGLGPPDQPEFDKFHQLGLNGNQIDGALNVRGTTTITADPDTGGEVDLVVQGKILASGTVTTATRMAQKGGGVLAPTPDDFLPRLTEAIDRLNKSVDQALELLAGAYKRFFTDGLYEENRAGNSDLIGEAGFSWRDPPDQSQYRTDGWELPEARWQRWVRLGLAQGGQPWRETPLRYQGRQLMGFPGKKAWNDNPTFLQTDASDIVEIQEGRAADRGAAYETARHGQARRVPPQGNFLTLLSGPGA